MPKKTDWSNDRIITIYNSLRAGRPTAEIARQIGVNPQALYNYLKRDDNETIMQGLQLREEWREQHPLKKKRVVGFISENMEKAVQEQNGMSSYEVSKRNMAEFYADEIQLVKSGRGDEVDGTVKSLLVRYALIPKPVREAGRL